MRLNRVYYNEIDPRMCAWLRQLISDGHLPDGYVDCRPIEHVTPKELEPYEQCHFFAGIGGWPLALALAGWEGPVWTGSCPCQPFSVAGKGKGEDDPRHVWPAFRARIAERRPSVIFGEQVAGAAGRLWLAGVRDDLEKLGYAVGAADLCAAGIGAPHIRQRLYWVADATNRTRNRPELRNNAVAHSGKPVSRLEHAESDGRGERRAESGGRGIVSRREFGGMEHTNGAGCGEYSGTEPVGPELVAVECAGRIRPWDAFELVPCADGKVRRIEPGSFWMVNGLSDEMDALWNACLRKIKETINAYAKTTEADAEQIMREMRKGIAPEALRRTTGRFDRLSETELLFAALCELKGKLGNIEHGSPQRGTEVLQGCVREMQTDYGAPRSPSGQKYSQQLEGELADIVRELPQEITSHFMTSFPLIGKVVGRVGLLRGYGNAIVPQLAAEFVRAYVEARHLI